ncbi:MAG: hypothetical protein IPK60_21645 [Sandaracinaceae bacterium]|nr:hypothetical protein [Sandaracinaceae bacterium]
MAASLLKPDHGARLLFERLSVDDARVTYRVTVALAETSHVCEIAIARSDGAISFAEWTAGTPDAWSVDSARAFLKTIYASHKDAAPADWPRKLRRWRAPRD